ncbi:MAG: aldo/keto reductase, partial [Chitinophagaceae bacterium]
GLLVGKASKDYLGYSAEEIENAADAIRTCETADRTATQTALRFVLQHSAVTSAVAGVSKMEQLKDIAGTTDSPILKEKEISILRKSIPAKKYLEHR